MVAQQHRGWLGHRHLLRGLRDGGSGCRDINGSDRSKADLPAWCCHDNRCCCRFRLVGGWILLRLYFSRILGVGWAGTYMLGLKALSDIIEGPQQSRAMSAHAASVGISGAASFLVAETIGAWFGWRWGIGVGAIGAGLALLLALFALPKSSRNYDDVSRGALLDFRPVLRNRSALAYSIGYLVHTWEMSTLRSWVVTFLTFAALCSGDESDIVTPAVVAMCLGLVGTMTSVAGNEAARRFGRVNYITFVMLVSAVFAAFIGFWGGSGYWLTAVLCLLYAGVIWADSSTLTAGTVGSAVPEFRGATMAVHSMLGYLGGFMGPLVFGIVLDAQVGTGPTDWGFAFIHLSVVVMLGLAALRLLRPQSLAGDRDPA